MSFVVTCQSCGRLFTAPDTADGKSANCPKCGAQIDILRPRDITDDELNELENFIRNEPKPQVETRPSPDIPVIVTAPTRSPAKRRGRLNAHELVIGTFIGGLIGVLLGGPDRNISLVVSWAIIGFVAVLMLRLSQFFLKRNTRIPLVLRLMKLATLLWVAGMILNGTLIYLGYISSVVEIASNTYMRRG